MIAKIIHALTSNIYAIYGRLLAAITLTFNGNVGPRKYEEESSHIAIGVILSLIVITGPLRHLRHVGTDIVRREVKVCKIIEELGTDRAKWKGLRKTHYPK